MDGPCQRRHYDFQRAPRTKPSTAATASVAIGWSLMDLSTAPFTLPATSCMRSAASRPWWATRPARSSAWPATSRNLSVVLSVIFSNWSVAFAFRSWGEPVGWPPYGGLCADMVELLWGELE